MSAESERIKALRSTRLDYAEECAWHKFLIDAAFGTGGFRGKIGPTAVSQLGWAAEAYSQLSVLTTDDAITFLPTYLDQFAREDEEKFRRRVDMAHYTNYVGPIHDILVSYLNKADAIYESEPPKVKAWMDDVDAKGSSWQTWMRDVVRPRASLLGWMPVVFDADGGEADGPLTKAQEKQLGRRIKAIPLFPVNLLDWICDDDGKMVAAKVRIVRTRRDNLLGGGITEELYSLWYEDRVESYTVSTSSNNEPKITAEEAREHDMGAVPIVTFRPKATPDDRVRGISTIANSAPIARRLFNLESERQDHIRGQVFATLGIPVSDTADAKALGELVLGNSNAILVPKDANMMLHYVAPPASVAETLAQCIESTVRELYRVENVEYAKATGVSSASGVARAYEFEQTNKRLAGMAGSFSRDEQEALQLVGRIFGEANADDVKVTAPTDFSVEDPATEITATGEAMTLGLGATAERELKSRLVSRMLPNLPSATYDAIQSELDELRSQAEADKALAREVAASGLDTPEDGANSDDPSDDESGDNTGERL